MYNDQETKIGGASIKPSARRSIHDHQGGCQFKQGETEMRYGLDSELEPQAPQNSTIDEGRDEIDNVLSKHRAPRSSATRNININERRKSLEHEHSIHTDDSDSSRHAQSLPTSLEARFSNSSDKYDNWLSPVQPNTSSESSSLNESQLHNGDSSPNHNRTTTPKAQLQPTLLLVGFLTTVVAVVLAVGNLPTFPEMFATSKTYNTATFYDDLNNLEQKYNVRHDAILQLQTGISTIFKRQDTGSFVIAYKSNSRDFHQEEFNDLVNTIATAASKYLRNDSTSTQHIVVDGSKLEMRSHSELINKYREDLTKTGVMLVTEVDEVPSALAMAFHYYCDEYNPLVKRSAIFFTLDMAKCSHNLGEQNPTHAQIEKCLKKKWSGVPSDNISPLLNRVVSTVVDVAGL